jgi:hypothetical protein
VSDSNREARDSGLFCYVALFCSGLLCFATSGMPRYNIRPWIAGKTEKKV